MSDCLFCKIIAGEIPSAKLYEDDDVLVFKDINPEAPVHFLVIPKKHITGPAYFEEEDEQCFGKMMRVASRVAREQGIGENFRVVLNNGPQAGQTVFHVHMHILGGRPMGWPPG